MMRRRTSDTRPRWDREARELSIRRVRLKRLHHSSPNQEQLLEAFEEEGWRRIIDNPLPRTDGILSEQRLRNTVKQLNRTLAPRLIQFHTETGRGSGCCGAI